MSTSRTEIEILRQGVVVRVLHLPTPVIRVGRHPDNEVVLIDPYVSSAHALILHVGDTLVVRDLRSRNGTWINDQRLVGEAPVADGDLVRLGGDVALRLRNAREIQPQAFCVIDLGAGTMHPIQRDRATFGSRPDATILLRNAAAVEASMEISEDGEVWLIRAEGSEQLNPGDTFEVGRSSFRLEEVEQSTSATWPVIRKVEYDYELVTSLDAPGGAYARLTDPSADLSRVVGAENRATVLFVLARRRLADLEVGLPKEDAGWMDDEEVMVAIWGRLAHSRAPSTYAVLLHRIRRELLEAGFDPGFLERRRGACRLRLDRIRLGIVET